MIKKTNELLKERYSLLGSEYQGESSGMFFSYKAFLKRKNNYVVIKAWNGLGYPRPDGYISWQGKWSDIAENWNVYKLANFIGFIEDDETKRKMIELIKSQVKTKVLVDVLPEENNVCEDEKEGIWKKIIKLDDNIIIEIKEDIYNILGYKLFLNNK